MSGIKPILLTFCTCMHAQIPIPGHNIIPFFGAVVEDGYGLSYNPQETQVLFSVSSCRQCPHTDSQLFVSMLVKSMREMHDVMMAAKGTKSKL